MKNTIRRARFLIVTAPAAAIVCGLAPLHALAWPPRLKKEPAATTNHGVWELRILHTSDQEAGKKALIDIPAMVAAIDRLDQPAHPNTLKLTSGDLFIAGSFMDASQYLYSNKAQYKDLKTERLTLEPLTPKPGTADIIIINGQSWQAAVIGNHECDGISQSQGVLNKHNFFAPTAANRKISNYDGKANVPYVKQYTLPVTGIGKVVHPGATSPYLSANIDFDSFKANEAGDTIFKAYGLKNNTDKPHLTEANVLARSTSVNVGDSKVGVIGATTPFLPDIVGAPEPRHMLPGTYRSKETSTSEQAAALKPLSRLRQSPRTDGHQQNRADDPPSGFSHRAGTHQTIGQ